MGGRGHGQTPRFLGANFGSPPQVAPNGGDRCSPLPPSQPGASPHNSRRAPRASNLLFSRARAHDTRLVIVSDPGPDPDDVKVRAVA